MSFEGPVDLKMELKSTWGGLRMANCENSEIVRASNNKNIVLGLAEVPKAELEVTCCVS